MDTDRRDRHDGFPRESGGQWLFRIEMELLLIIVSLLVFVTLIFRLTHPWSTPENFRPQPSSLAVSKLEPAATHPTVAGVATWTPGNVTATVVNGTALPALPNKPPTARDFQQCVKPTLTPRRVDFEVFLVNSCPVKLDEFLATFKIYDQQDARIGWTDITVERMDPGEKVRFVMPYPVKDYPSLIWEKSVSRVVIDSFK